MCGSVYSSARRKVMSLWWKERKKLPAFRSYSFKTPRPYKDLESSQLDSRSTLKIFPSLHVLCTFLFRQTYPPFLSTDMGKDAIFSPVPMSSEANRIVQFSTNSRFYKTGKWKE